VYKQILITEKLKTDKRGDKRADWGKTIKEANVRTGLLYHQRKRKRRY
jgi:hypothetical protein